MQLKSIISHVRIGWKSRFLLRERNVNGKTQKTFFTSNQFIKNFSSLSLNFHVEERRDETSLKWTFHFCESFKV